MMWKYTELSYYLANLYFRFDDITDIIQKAGIGVAFVQTSNRAVTFWGNIIRYAENKGGVKHLVQAVLNDDHQEDPFLLAFLADENTTFKSPFSNNTLDKPVEPTSTQMEKLTMGSSTFLPISFLATGLSRSKSVVKIVTADSAGTGFIIQNNYLLTNNHVIDSIETARDAETKFFCNYEAGQKEEPFTFAPDEPHGFETSKKNDWTIIKISTAGDGVAEKLQAYGCLQLEDTEVKKDDFVNIIQHPEGNRKQIAMYHNLVMGCDEERVHYLTDTLPGSSGSPVFNSKWEVVALHHAGGELMVRGTNKKELVNEGIRINLVLKEIREKGIEI